MFYSFIDENTIKRAPRPLNIDGKDVFTNSEKIHNKQGYFKLVEADYPQDDKNYKPTYSLQDNVIVQAWTEVEIIETETI